MKKVVLFLALLNVIQPVLCTQKYFTQDERMQLQHHTAIILS